MIRRSSLVRSLLLALAMVMLLAAGGKAEQSPQGAMGSESAGQQNTADPPQVMMTLEPKAIDILKAACSRLAAARTMSFTAVATYENPSLLGPPLVYTTKSEVTLQRPDKLRVITPGDGPPSEFYYDGKTMTAFAPAENLAAVAEAPPTIDEVLTTAFEKAAIYFPFGPMITADPYQGIAEGMILAFYIGQSQIIGGTTTDMVAFANDNVFLQVWIGAEDKLPRMLRGVYRDDPAHLRQQIEFSNWQIDLAVPPDAFVAKDAINANPIVFASPDPEFSSSPASPEKGQMSNTNGTGK